MRATAHETTVTATASFFVRAYARDGSSLRCTGIGGFRFNRDFFRQTAQSMREYTLYKHRAELGITRRERRYELRAGCLVGIRGLWRWGRSAAADWDWQGSE